MAESGDGLDTVRLVERLEPDVLVLDLMMPGLGGLDVLSIIRQRCPRTRSVVFSMYANEEFVLQALKNGAIAYVLKGCDPAHAVEAVRHAAEGRRISQSRNLRAGLRRLPGKGGVRPSDLHDMLTPRERQVLQLAAEGRSCSEIAVRLSISPRTAEMHRGNAMRKLELKSRAELVRYAVRRGMIQAPPADTAVSELPKSLHHRSKYRDQPPKTP